VTSTGRARREASSAADHGGRRARVGRPRSAGLVTTSTAGFRRIHGPDHEFLQGADGGEAAPGRAAPCDRSNVSCAVSTVSASRPVSKEASLTMWIAACSVRSDFSTIYAGAVRGRALSGTMAAPSADAG